MCHSTRNDGTYNRLVIRTKAGKFVRFWFADQTASPLTNGYLSKEENLDPTREKFFCSELSGNVTDLTDKSAAGVNIKSGQFIIVEGTESKDIVTIKFSVGPSLKAASGFDTTVINPISFETTVQVR